MVLINTLCPDHKYIVLFVLSFVFKSNINRINVSRKFPSFFFSLIFYFLYLFYVFPIHNTIAKPFSVNLYFRIVFNSCVHNFSSAHELVPIYFTYLSFHSFHGNEHDNKRQTKLWLKFSAKPFLSYRWFDEVSTRHPACIASQTVQQAGKRSTKPFHSAPHHTQIFRHFLYIMSSIYLYNISSRDNRFREWSRSRII